MTSNQDQPRTVRVRCLVGTLPNGKWFASGWSDSDEDAARDNISMMADDEPGQLAFSWLTADVPLPTEPEIAAKVGDAS